jgi:ribosomal protein L11 methylase PrmA
MLELAGVGNRDLVYDLGCGDGRIVIAAARTRGARAVGIDINPERIREARANAARAGVANRVRFEQRDLFEADLRKATVVTLYLLPGVNQRLRPILLRQLRPGTRIVSHAFDMGRWKADRISEVEGRTVYLWRVPDRGRAARIATGPWR